MDTTKLEIGLIGDFLVGSMSAHTLPLKGERGEGLSPEHFSDPSARAAYEEILKAGSYDPATLQARLLAKMGGAFCEKAIENAATLACYAPDRIRQLAAEGRKRLAKAVMRYPYCDEARRHLKLCKSTFWKLLKSLRPTFAACIAARNPYFSSLR